MGLFSSKKKTYVATQVSPLFSDGDIPTLRKKNIIDSVFDDKPLRQTIINNTLNSFTTKVELGYRKAARGDYYYGAPSQTILNSGDGKDIAQNILENKHNAPVRFKYFHFAPLNNIHLAWQTLTNDYGYDELTNTVIIDGVTYWVDTIEATVNTQAITSDESDEEFVPDEGTLALWEAHPEKRYNPTRETTNGETVWYFSEDVEDGAVIKLNDRESNKKEIVVKSNGYDRDLECFQIKYQFTENGQTITRYFTHEYGAPAYPQLNTVHNKQATRRNTFFPVFVFRSRSRNVAKNKNSEAYKSSVALARTMDLDYEYMAQSVEENPNVDDLEQAVLMMGVPAYTHDAAEAEYLFRFFDWVYVDSDSSSNFKSNYLDNNRPGKSIRIGERDFDTTLSFSQITRRYRRGSFGAVGAYQCIKTTDKRYHTIRRRRRVRDDNGDYSYEWYVTRIPYFVEVLKYQRQDTKNKYTEILVDNLKLRYDIYGDKGITANVGSNKLLVPVDYYIAREMRYDKKERVYHTSLHFVFNTRVTERVKWYESGIFQVVMVVIAVAITIFTAGAGSPLGVALAGAAYGTAALLILQSLVINAVIGLAVQEAAKVVIDELGIDAGVVLAVVAAVAAVYGGFSGADWAGKAMAVASNLGSAHQEAVQDVMKDYQSEAQEFALMAEEKMEELEEVENLLNNYDLLDPRSFIGKVPEIIVGETPSNLYERTVHVGNPGILQYDYIKSYVAINTQLPTFDDLVGEKFV